MYVIIIIIIKFDWFAACYFNYLTLYRYLADKCNIYLFTHSYAMDLF